MRYIKLIALLLLFAGCGNEESSPVAEWASQVTVEELERVSPISMTDNAGTYTLSFEDGVLTAKGVELDYKLKDWHVTTDDASFTIMNVRIDRNGSSEIVYRVGYHVGRPNWLKAGDYR